MSNIHNVQLKAPCGTIFVTQSEGRHMGNELMNWHYACEHNLRKCIINIIMMFTLLNNVNTYIET